MQSHEPTDSAVAVIAAMKRRPKMPEAPMNLSDIQAWREAYRTWREAEFLPLLLQLAGHPLTQARRVDKADPFQENAEGNTFFNGSLT